MEYIFHFENHGIHTVFGVYTVPVRRLTTAEEDNKEILWLLLRPPRTSRPFSSIIVAIVYYPPGQSADCGTDMIEYLTRNLDRLLCDRLSSAIAIAGDFNKLNLTRLFNRFNHKKSSYPCSN